MTIIEIKGGGDDLTVIGMSGQSGQDVTVIYTINSGEYKTISLPIAAVKLSINDPQHEDNKAEAA